MSRGCHSHHCESHHCDSHDSEHHTPRIAPPPPGGWTSWLPLTRVEEQIFFKEVSGLIGAEYIPCLVQSQEVAGTNYLFLAKREIITGAGITIDLVTIAIFVDLQGNIRRSLITQIGH